MKPLPVLFGALFLSSLLASGVAQAHSADTFTVVIKESGLTPNTSQIAYNDSVVWHNTDARENITHRIVFDFDGDGLFNGTWGVGEYEYQDMLSDGTILNGTIVVTEDIHVENSTAPAIGSTFGTFENDDKEEDGVVEESDANEMRRLLLLVGGGSGLGAIILLVILMRRSS